MSDKNQMSPAQIKAALKAGIITPEQAAAMNESAQPAPSQAAPVKAAPAQTANSPENAAIFGNEDDMRFIRGFSDIFIGIGLIMLTLGVGALTGLLGGHVLFLAAAGVMWAGSEYFGRKKRSHFPTLILALSFLFFFQKGAAAILPSDLETTSIRAALITLGAMLAYYMRFRLPFCIALITLAALGLIYSLLIRTAPDMMAGHFGLVMLMSGLITFTIAMLYDMRDIDRRTRFADNAFWLHLMAAPLIVHGLAVMTIRKTTQVKMGFLPQTNLDQPDAVFTLIAVIILAFIGLAINRRAIIASSIIYAIIALLFLIGKSGLSISATIISVLLLAGAAIVFLGAGWHAARRALLKILPRAGVWAKIFPPESYQENRQ